MNEHQLSTWVLRLLMGILAMLFWAVAVALTASFWILVSS